MNNNDFPLHKKQCKVLLLQLQVHIEQVLRGIFEMKFQHQSNF